MIAPFSIESMLYEATATPGGFHALWAEPLTPPHTYRPEIWATFDTLGNVITQRPITTDTLYTRVQYLDLPGGLLTVGFKGNANRINQTDVRRLDNSGQVIWQRRMGYWSFGYFMRPLLDGSYVVVATDPTQYGHINQNLFRFDYKVYRVTAGGAVLDSAWVGVAGAWESPFQVKATTDGGLLICGFESPFPASNPRRGTLIKLDSTFQEQWKYSIFDTCCDAETGVEIRDAWEAANGRYVVQAIGLTGTNWQEVIPPAQSGQPASSGWIYTLPPTARPAAHDISYLLYETGSPAYGFGLYDRDFFAPQPTNEPDFYQCRLTGLPAPAVLDYCRRPPSRPVATMGALVGDSIRFSVDATRQTAGPRYAEISLVEWDFGDGTPRQQGWDVWHRFALPTPVAVRLRLCNNLSCCRDSVFFPFGQPVGVPEVAALPAVSVYPNPSASGVFNVQVTGGPRLRALAPATACVTDGLGQEVWRGVMAVDKGEVDLSAQPTGLYVLSLIWPDGHTVRKKLMR